MAKYKKNGAEIDAVQWTGFNIDEVVEIGKGHLSVQYLDEPPTVRVHMPAGVQTLTLGDYLVRGADGNVYPMKMEQFDKAFNQA